MTARQYIAAIRHDGAPKTLEIIGEGTKPQCEGAVQAWSSLVVPTPGDVALILVVAE